jgi:hypothetical protein
MSWWAWSLFGIVLLVGEVLTPGGFYLLFFGLGALAVGALGPLGIELPAWAQWLLFAALSIVATLFFRKPLLARLQAKSPAARADELTGEIAAPREAIAPGAVGSAELRGTVWAARNGSSQSIAAGQRCRVVRIDGLQIVLEPE